MSIKLNIKKLKENARMPLLGSKYAAGADLYSCISIPVEVAPHETVKIGTGLAMEIPEGYFGAIFARSGLATKQGLRPANCVGVVDSDYRGEIIVAIHNDTDMPKTITDGERIAQLVIMPYMSIEMNEVDTLSDTERNDGGFGHSGMR